MRVLDIDGIDDPKQLGNAVTFRAHEALSIPMDQAVLDYHVVGTTTVRDGRGRPIASSLPPRTASRSITSSRRVTVRTSRSPGSMSKRSRFFAPSLPAPARADGERTAVVALALGHDRSTLAISDGEVCDFTRVLEWGGGKLDTAIGRELGLSAEEADELKRAVTLGDADDGDVVDARVVRARGAVKKELTNLARELVASLQFYQGQPGSLAIAEILVTGGTTRMPGLVEELERLVRARIRVADPLAAVDASQEVLTRDDLASLAVAIGLGVER